MSLDDAIAASTDDAKVGRKQIEKMAEALIQRGIDPEEVGKITRISMWQGLTKNDDGEAEIHDLFGFRINPKWEEGPQWPVVEPAKPVKATAPKVKVLNRHCVDVIGPDIQFGFWRDRDGELQPTHDPAALDVFVLWCAALQPSRIVLVGDNLDLPDFGKYRKHPSFSATTQAALDACHRFLAQLRAACPDAEIKWLAGNHEERLPNFIIDNAVAAFGLRQANQPESWPVLSVPHLLHLDELDIEYLPGYPAAKYWLTDNLVVVHGDRVKSRGSTADKYLTEHKVSVIYGHVHRIERAHITRDDFDGDKEIMAASPGCLCQTNGVVPSTKQGLDLDGRPLERPENWQQGFGVVYHYPDGRWNYEQAWIADGVGYFNGDAISAT